MISIDAKINLREVNDGFFGLTKRAEMRTREFFRAIKPKAKAELRQRGRKRESPSGRWAPAALSTRRRARRGRGNRRPGNLGALTRAWKSYLDPDSLKLRNMIRYAQIHHEGGVAGRGARIPARPFAWFSRDFQKEATELWAEWVLSGWKKG